MTSRLLFALLLIASAAHAEEVVEDFIVTEIEIIGNFRTKEWVILRELRFDVGDRILIDDMEAARNRLLSLQIFNNVFIEGDDEGVVTIEVSEQFRFIPLLGLTATDGRTQDAFTDFGSFFDIITATVGVADLNHMGSGGQAGGTVRFGATTGFAVDYRNRWLSPRLPVRFDLGLRTLNVSDKHASVQDISRRQRDQRAFVRIGTRLGSPTQIGMQLMFQRVSRHESETAPRINDRTFWASPFIALDRRDLEWYPSRGVFALANLDVAGGSRGFVRSQAALNSYHSFNRNSLSPILALRLTGGTSTSSTPDWAHYYFGFADLLRGYGANKSEAATFLIGDVELRIPCMHEVTYDIPLLGRNGRNIPFWWGLLFFAERAEQQLDGLRKNTSALGAGVHIRVPYIQIIEFSGAVNHDGDSDFVFQTGVKF